MAVVLEIMVERQTAELSDAREADEFAEVYRRTYTPLVEHCRTRLRAGDEAEDIAQAALVKAWDTWDRFDRGRPFWPWVVTIARRLAIDNFRRSGRQDMLGSARPEGPSNALGPEDAVALKADAALALAALRQLKAQDQRIVGLRDIEGWSYEEVAEFEDESVDYVRRHAHRARVALRASYLRVSQRMAGFAVAGWYTKARRRLSLFTSRVPSSAATAPPAYEAGMQALSGLAVLVLVFTAGNHATVGRVSTNSGPSLTARAADAPTADVVAPIRAPEPSAVPSSDKGALAALGLDNVAVPEDAAFDSFTPAGYGTTVYAAGSGTGGCEVARCPAIFRSDDSGATWSRLVAAGYVGGDLLIPPAYPTDGRLFVASSFALQVSNDGGRSFAGIANVGGPAAMSPEFSNGDPRILLGAAPGWVYNDIDKSVTPLTSLSPPSSLTRTFAFSPSYGIDGRMLVGGTQAPLGGADVSTVTLCDAESCLSTATLDSLNGTPQILFSDSYASDRMVFAWRSTGLYRSVDGGRTFSMITLPRAALVETLVDNGPHGFLLAMSANRNTRAFGGLFSSSDGLHWREIGLGAGDVLAATRLGPRLLAGPSWSAGGGLRCSEDGGTTWRTRCGSGGRSG